MFNYNLAENPHQFLSLIKAAYNNEEVTFQGGERCKVTIDDLDTDFIAHVESSGVSELIVGHWLEVHAPRPQKSGFLYYTLFIPNKSLSLRSNDLQLILKDGSEYTLNVSVCSSPLNLPLNAEETTAFIKEGGQIQTRFCNLV